MRQKIYIELITSRLFILGLIILILNDNLLKYFFPGFISGKLSDFSGMLIFPIFISIFIYRWKKLVYILTGILFIYWKSSLSQPCIDFWNSLCIINIYRTIDYSDLIALIILPFSYKYINEFKCSCKNIGFFKVSFIGFFTIITFCATTLPRQYFKRNIDLNKEYLIPMSKMEFFNSVHFRYGYSDTLEKNMLDSIFYCYYYVSDNWTNVEAVVKITELDKGSLSIEIDSVVGYTIPGRLLSGISRRDKVFMEELSPQEYEKYFEENYINVLTGMNKFYNRDLFFDNKDLIDKYIKRRN